MSCNGLGSRLRQIEAELGGLGGEICQDFNNVVTDSNVFETLVDIPVPLNASIRIKFGVLAKSADDSHHAMFERLGHFYRVDGAVQAQSFWETSATDKSHPGFDVDYVLGADKVTLRLKSPVTDEVVWSGQVCKLLVPT